DRSAIGFGRARVAWTVPPLDELTAVDGVESDHVFRHVLIALIVAGTVPGYEETLLRADIQFVFRAECPGFAGPRRPDEQLRVPVIVVLQEVDLLLQQFEESPRCGRCPMPRHRFLLSISGCACLSPTFMLQVSEACS